MESRRPGDADILPGLARGRMSREVMKTALGGALPGVLSEFALVREGGLVADAGCAFV